MEKADIQTKPKSWKFAIHDQIFEIMTQYSKYFLMLFAGLIICGSYFGLEAVASLGCLIKSYFIFCRSPIHCISQNFNSNTMSPDKREHMVQTFCWTMGTFINTAYMNGTIGFDLLYYGIAFKTYKETRKYQRYYMFIAPTIALQALIFYAPYWIWKQWESGMMNYFMNSTNDKDKKNEEDCKNFKFF